MTVSSTKYDVTSGYNGYFVGGTTKYVFASAYAEDADVGGSLTLSKDYTVYFDANGYVIGAVLDGDAATDTVVNYAVLLDKVRQDGSELNGTVAYERAKVYTSEGKVVVLDAAVELNSDGYTAKKWILPSASSSSKLGTPNVDLNSGDLISYTLNEDGELTKVTKATQTAGLTNHKKGTAFNTVAGGAYASAKTVIFVCKSGTTLTGRNDIAVYTGYATVPTGDYTAGKAFAADTKNAGALTATIAALPGAENTKAQYIVLTDDAPVVSAGTDGFKYKYTWNAIVDGKETEVYELSDSTTASYESGKLAEVTFNSKTGAIATFTDVTLHNKQITAVTDGFYAATDVMYTASSTVYYKVVCENTQALTQGKIEGFEAVEGFDTLGETVEVYQTFASGGKSASEPVKVVFFYTYLK